MRDRNRFFCNVLVVSLLLAGIGTIIQAQDQEPMIPLVRLADMSDSKLVSSDNEHDFPISYDLTIFVWKSSTDHLTQGENIEPDRCKPARA
jgi:hypothetical protein